jgi:2-amino-4-hydroxy-6-hydroxymethyldihydropteridine diphosphokinase
MQEIQTAIGLGGNLGNVKDIFHKAARDLQKAGLENIIISSIYKTKPVGCDPGTPDFLNAALTGTWRNSLEQLFELCKQLEEKAGRPRIHPRYASRTLDLDILLFGSFVCDSAELTIPHKEAYKRLFVLVPLAEIASDWLFPDTKKTIGETLSHFHDSSEYENILKSKLK